MAELFESIKRGLAEAIDHSKERKETLHLSARDSQTFLAVLENPPEPSAKLIEAMKAHSRLTVPSQ